MLFSNVQKRCVENEFESLKESFHPTPYIEENEKLPAVMMMKIIINFSISTLYGTLFSSERMLIKTKFNKRFSRKCW